jgi:hypothetical protein
MVQNISIPAELKLWIYRNQSSYAHGIPNELLLESSVGQEKVTAHESLKLLFIINSDSEQLGERHTAERIDAIASNALNLQKEEYKIIRFPSEGAMYSKIIDLKKLSGVVAFNIPYSFFAMPEDTPKNVFVQIEKTCIINTFSVSEIFEEVGKKKQFWNELKKMKQLIL